MHQNPLNIAVFASGSGTNAANIFDYFLPKSTAKVRLLVTNNPKAGVMAVASDRGMTVLVLSPEDVRDGSKTAELLIRDGIDVIVLAGYLKLVPDAIIRAYEGRIVNLHPALLPHHGGPGMYGSHVHRAVKAAADSRTGITLHYVSAEYDRGEVIAQFETAVMPADTEADIEAKVRKLEKTHLPVALETWMKTIH